MPTIEHDGLVELVRQYPPLGVELLRHVGTFALPAAVKADLGSEDMSDVTPRANGRERRQPGPQQYAADSVVVVSDPVTGNRLLAIVIEPQGEWADEKAVSWPVYATTARKANKCPRAVLIAVCWNRAEARKCRRIIATGHPGLIFIPIVLSADNAPSLAGASPYLTLFNAVIGAVDLDTPEGRVLAVEAITATGAKGADHRTLCKIMLDVASDAAQRDLEDLMVTRYNHRNEFVDGWYEKGYEKGEARAKSDAILHVLKSRGLRLTGDQRELVETCADLDKLDIWFDRSLSATTVDGIFED